MEQQSDPIPQNNQPSCSPAPKQKKLLPIMLMIVILTLTGVATYFGYQTVQLKSEVASLKQQLIAPTPTSLPIAAPESSTSANPAVKEEKKFAYIKAITPVYDSYMLTVLYVNWINDDNEPNGYRVEGPSTELVTLPLEQNMQIVMQTISHGDVSEDFSKPITFGKFLSLYESNGPIKNALYELEMKNGTVTKISEQYQP